MLKVVIARTGHPDTLHYVSGTLVSWNSKGDDLLEPEMGVAAEPVAWRDRFVSFVSFVFYAIAVKRYACA
jgi:hypothetical protein